MTAHDHDATREITKSGVAEKVRHGFGDGSRVVAVSAQDGYASVRSRWVTTNVAEPLVQGDEESTGTSGGVQDTWIVSTSDAFVLHRVDVVTEFSSRVARVGG